MELLTENMKNVVMTDMGFLMCFSYFTHLNQIFQIFEKIKEERKSVWKHKKHSKWITDRFFNIRFYQHRLILISVYLFIFFSFLKLKKWRINFEPRLKLI